MELWNEEINAKKIIAVKDPTHAVEKRRPEKIMSCVFDCDDLLCIYFFILRFQYSCLSNSNIHCYIFIFPGYIMNQFNDHPSWLAGPS